MLKKVLASALAVATVATCAYVPSAFASAATAESKTASRETYTAWLNSQDKQPTTTVNVSIVSDKSSLNNTSASFTLDTEGLGAESVKAALHQKMSALETTLDAEYVNFVQKGKLSPYQFSVSVAPGADNKSYHAYISYKKAVFFNPNKQAGEFNKPNETYPESLDSKVLKDAGLTLLGYYPEITANDVATKMMLETQVAAKAPAFRVAAKKRTGFKFDDAKNIVFAVTDTLNDNDWNGTDPIEATHTLKLKVQKNDGNSPKALELINGTYAGKTQVKADILVPVYDKANWEAYLRGEADVNAALEATNKVTVDGVDYIPAGLKAVPTSTANTDKIEWVITYKKQVPVYDTTTTYTLKVGTGSDLKFTTVRYGNNNPFFTSNVADIYKMNPADDYTKDMVAKYPTVEALLNRDKENTGVVYELGKLQQYNTSANGIAATATVAYEVIANGGKTVYSYDEKVEGKVLKTDKVFLSKDQSTEIGQKLTATAKDLGIAEAVVIGGTRYVFDYAKNDVDNSIATVYKMQALEVEMNDFAMATGKFNDKAYFGRAAKAGNKVTLKVSLSKAGEDKALDLTKVTVKFNVEGAKASKNYEFKATEQFKAGVASDITLGKGFNMVTATVSYDGKEIGTTAPFFAYVGK